MTTTNLTHYIIVRRDLPLGTLAAMITHAAGESANVYHGDEYDGRFRGATAVVLEVKDESTLKKVESILQANNIRHVVVQESTPPYNGAWMAIGVVPLDRAELGDLLADLQTLKQLYVDEEADTCDCHLCEAAKKDIF